MRHQVKTWRGISAGWVTVGRPKTKEEALLLCAFVNRVQNNYSHKVDVLPVELFPIHS